MPVVCPSDRGVARWLLRGPPHIAALFACTLGAGCSTPSLGLQKDGTYNLDSGEQAMDCQRLSNNIWGRLQVLKSLPAKAKGERAAAAPTAAQAFGRWFGRFDQRARLPRGVRSRACPRAITASYAHQQGVPAGRPRARACRDRCGDLRVPVGSPPSLREPRERREIARCRNFSSRIAENACRGGELS